MLWLLGRRRKKNVCWKIETSQKIGEKIIGWSCDSKNHYTMPKEKNKEMEKKMKLNNRLKINTEREEINLDDFNENRIEI